SARMTPVAVLGAERVQSLPGFRQRLAWFVQHRQDLSRHITHCERDHGHRLIAIPSHDRLERVLRYLLDENEFLSPCGIRSLSKVHEKTPYEFRAGYE